jgi:hypothetical protein
VADEESSSASGPMARPILDARGLRGRIEAHYR